MQFRRRAPRPDQPGQRIGGMSAGAVQSAPNGAGASRRPVRHLRCPQGHVEVVRVSDRQESAVTHGRGPDRDGAGRPVHADRLPASRSVAPVVSLAVVYLPAVLIVSITWGAWLGVLTGVMSAAGVRLLPPASGGPPDDQRLQAVGGAGGVHRGDGARQLGQRDRAGACARRRRPPPRGGPRRRAGDGCCSRGDSLAQALPTVAARLAGDARAALGGDRDEAVEGDERTVAFPLRDGTGTIATLLVGRRLPRRRACGG